MKAAVINNFGITPRYEDFVDPVPSNDEILVHVKAVVLENFEKGVAGGKHYSSKNMYPQFPAVVGHRGIGMTPDGKLIGFSIMWSPYGSFAEKAVAKNFTPIPDGIDAEIAAAIPPSALTSLLPFKNTVKLNKGETVLINGATGVSGRMAIQIAKLLGAGRIIGTGRNETSLKLIKSLGADAVIDLKQSDENLLDAFEKEGGEKGYDVVIDFLWGHPAEILMQSFVPKSMGVARKRIRYVSIGEKAGSVANIKGEMLRTSGLELSGAGKISPEEISAGMMQVWDWIKENKLHMDIEKVRLADIEKAWLRNDLEGKRLVIIP
ncbi:zinc-binding alcohol dehydrogenase family protein [Chitinophaga sp. MM2321]|uniref:quinone oxidoreductase family protein n=1 Tax=Chitinophaga sp. MM2321 TaxID=3137178 RepID=UPI0032D57348